LIGVKMASRLSGWGGRPGRLAGA